MPRKTPKKRATKHLHADPRIIGAWFRQHGLPVPVAEYRIDPSRRFRWDWVLDDPCLKIAIEINGGVFSGGAHGRGTGIVRDMEKMNLAVSHGWVPLAFQPKELFTAKAMDTVRQVVLMRMSQKISGY